MTFPLDSVISQFIHYLGNGITDLAKYIGEGLNGAVREMFLSYTVDAQTNAITITGLNEFGGIVAVLFGISLAIGLTKLVFHFFTNMGKN